MILVQGTPVYQAFPYCAFMALTTICWVGGVSGEQSGSQRQRAFQSHTPGNSRGVLLLGLGVLCLASCWAKDSMLASSCSGRAGPGYCSFCSVRDRVTSCLILCLPWAQKIMWEKGAVIPCQCFLTGRTPSHSFLKTKSKIKQTPLRAKKGQIR